MNAAELKFNCPRLNTYAMESFTFFICNKFAKILKNSFFYFVSMVYGV